MALRPLRKLLTGPLFDRARTALPALSAREKCGDKKKVRVSVVVILATERDGKVHPKLKCIAEEVKKLHPKLTGFRLVQMSCQSLPVGGKDDELEAEWHLVDGQGRPIDSIDLAD